MKCQFYLKKCLLCLRPHFHFCCYSYFRPLLSLIGTLAGNNWYQPPLPLVPVLYLPIACTRAQPQGKPSGAAHRVESKCLSMIFKGLCDLGPAQFSDFSSSDALMIQCPSHTWHHPSSLICHVLSCFCDFVSSTWTTVLSLLCLVETHPALKAQPHGMESVQTSLSNLIHTGNGWSTKRIKEGNFEK